MLRKLYCLVPTILPAALAGQGFAGLGQDVAGFAEVLPEPAFIFPQDHGSHPDFRVEWWYLTANLADAEGRDFGLQWTLFRTALAPGEAVGWDSPQIWFAHVGVTGATAHFADERFARGGTGQAGVEAAPFAAWIDDWSLSGESFDDLLLQVAAEGFGYDMRLMAEGPLVFHGQDGFSIKSTGGQASYYYSQPFFSIEGDLRLGDEQVAVSGTAWLDREWSSRPLAPDQEGWDWMALKLDGGARLMLFQLRSATGEPFFAGSWITPSGALRDLTGAEITLEPLAEHDVAGRNVPSSWRVRVPSAALDVTVSAINPNAWMPLSPSYWEGPVSVAGSHSGRGYLEMTGYASAP